ncbi:hypothetical protein I2I11_16970 [Pontibacter sp. 172403-2]|uniref:hypothetical protein n=1 Tax=Pontibacter rufus TaxID=2791028 RepID=UPI0018AFECA1|nr:hypothetical protein [Pontibacter sp. 172403-2]MBF9254999.1 hypothetical protein [Pontibacter sp. 172403-2]
MSDWPVPFLLDELWLKTRRTIVHKLEEKSLWLNSDEYSALWSGQKEEGLVLRNSLLKDALGPDDFAVINSEAAFGKLNHVLKHKLPFSLAFGYELGAGFHTLVSGDQERKHQIAQTTSLFNLGISLFDFFLDSSEEEVKDEFKSIFNSQALHEIQGNKHAGSIFYKRCDTIEQNEIRILLKVIACFYQTLYSTVQEADNRHALKKINQLLLQAYQAEINSQLQEDINEEVNLRQVSKSKSTLPFRIIKNIAVAQTKADKNIEQSVERLSYTIGEIFWLLDDLADAVSDYQTNQLNSLFCNQEGKGCIMGEGAITQILATDNLPRLVNHLCSKIQRVELSISSSGTDNEADLRFRQILLFYIRDWLS